MGNKAHLSDHTFLASVREYLPMDAAIRETDANGNPGRNAPLSDLAENTFYVFDAEAMCAVGHAIEDLAMEEADGQITSAFQVSANFETHRERYCHIAATIDRVQVLAAGKPPGAARRVKFLRDTKVACKEFWLVAYEGGNHHGLVVCQQLNKPGYFEEGKYRGFFTFDRQLVARFREEVQAAGRGRSALPEEFGRLLALDSAAKQIGEEFAREKEEMSAMFLKLMRKAGDFHATKFAADLDKGLSRLQQWKTRLPELLARAERR